MNSYITVLKDDYKTNEVAQALALVAVCCTMVFGSLIVVAWANGSTLNGMANALTFPLLFWGLAVSHFLLRPAVLVHYSK
jgi:hypothetical protein